VHQLPSNEQGKNRVQHLPLVALDSSGLKWNTSRQLNPLETFVRVVNDGADGGMTERASRPLTKNEGDACPQ
jgi:hypothetical protein